LPLCIANRTHERAERVARAWQGRAMPLDPLDAMEGIDGVIVAVSGAWTLTPQTADRVARDVRWVVDLSSPTALDADLAVRLGDRLLSIDSLMTDPSGVGEDPLRARLEALVDGTLDDLRAWTASAAERDAARDLAGLATEARAAELRALWREVHGLAPDQRDAIERMTERLTQRLLRDPLERLGHDSDGRYRRAAQDLFRL
jgi:glutamyl-tRNA reductase